MVKLKQAKADKPHEVFLYMLLTKKGLWKILIMAIAYITLGSICIALSILMTLLQMDFRVMLILGLCLFILCPLFALWGRYAEGKGKLIALGNKLVRNELKPAEFIKHYDTLRSSQDLVINKPSTEALLLLYTAYDALGDKESALSTIDEMISAASEKKKPFAKLIKVSALFSFGKIDEAEALFEKARTSKQDIICQNLTDAIFNTDRAMAMGDYKTVEFYTLKKLGQKVPKLDNLGLLILHAQLAEVYEKTADTDKAKLHYLYCAENGGETAVKNSAKAALERL